MPIDVSDSDGLGEFLQIEQMVSGEDPDVLRKFARDFAKESPPPHKLRHDLTGSCIDISDDTDLDANPYPLDGLYIAEGAPRQQRILTRHNLLSERPQVGESQSYDFENGYSPGPDSKLAHSALGTTVEQDFLADLDVEDDIISIDQHIEDGTNDKAHVDNTAKFLSDSHYQSAPDFGETYANNQEDLLSNSYFQAVERQSDNYATAKDPHLNQDNYEESGDLESKFHASIRKNSLAGIETDLNSIDEEGGVSTGTVVHLPKFLTLESVENSNTIVRIKSNSTGISRFLETDDAKRPLETPDGPADFDTTHDQSGFASSQQQQQQQVTLPPPSADDRIDEQLRLMEREINKLTDMQKEVDESLKKNAAEHAERMHKLEADKAEFDRIRKEEWAKIKKEKQQLDDRRAAFKDKDSKLKELTAELEKHKTNNQKLKEDMRRKDNNSRLTSEQLRSKIDTLTEENNTLKKRLELSDKAAIEMRQKILNLEKLNKMLQIQARSDTTDREQPSRAMNSPPRSHGPTTVPLNVHVSDTEQENDSMVTANKPLKVDVSNKTFSNIASSPGRNLSQTLNHDWRGQITKGRPTSADADSISPKRNPVHLSATTRPGSSHISFKEQVSSSVQQPRQPIALPKAAAGAPSRQSLSMHTPENDEVLKLLPYSTPDMFFRQFNESVLAYVKDAQILEQHTKTQRVDKVLSTGATLTEFDNGTMKLQIPHRGEINIKFQNNDLKQLHSDGKIVYFYHEKGILMTTIPVVLINPSAAVSKDERISVYRFSSGQIEKHYADNRKEVYYPDGSKKYVAADGSEHSILADGTESHYTP
ncbi:T-complex protein-10 [Giardia lamblia P15]|uniref:T-complex protein-10 n=1 Tax=Giardia intestinalis (strain P15) TaxID=658858 RepID=E1F425_GIAIA|nr:T-complex protein-10 [Giardia lamblia P15]